MVPIFNKTKRNSKVIKKEGIYTFGGKNRTNDYDYDLLILHNIDKEFTFTKPITSGRKPIIRSAH